MPAKIFWRAFFLLLHSVPVVATDPEWLKLLHYRDNTLGGFKSDIDGPHFFLSKKGRVDPEAELKATIEGVTSSSETACRFPARVQWLAEQGLISKEIAARPCDRYEEWKKKINPSSVWLVFASYYLNNPASMYGHTFFRIGRTNFGEGNPLLDYTANFAAATDSKNGLIFAAKGLLGGYPGTFSTHPYYMKVQQYNNLESRDLWEYKLNLTPEEIDRFLCHLWELGPTWMSYYFLNKNCSYQLLPLLEAAKPDLNLSSQFQFRAIPLDTLRVVLNQKNLVGEIKYRPSHLTQMIARRDKLTPEERKVAQSLNVDEKTPRHVLESTYDYWRYKNGFERDLPETARAKEREILLLLKNSSPVQGEGRVGAPTPPEAAHGTGRVGLGFGADRHTTFEEFSVRPALHDIEEDPTGFVKGSELEMFSLKIRHNNDRSETYLENFTFIDILSLTPYDPWAKSPTWRVRAEIKPAKDLEKDPEEALHGTVNGGTGITFGPFSAMVEMDGAVGSVFDDGYRAGAGGSARLLFVYWKGWVTHAMASAMRYPTGHVDNVVRFRLAQTIPVGKDWTLRLSGERHEHYVEGLASVNRYF